MKQLHEKALKAYIEMLQIHINTKTSELPFHQASEDFYEKLFDIAHKIGERYVDLDGELIDYDLVKSKKRALEIIKQIKNEIEKYKEENEVSYGTDDLLGSLCDDLEDIEGTAKGFLK